MIETQLKYERRKTERKNTMNSFHQSPDEKALSSNSPTPLTPDMDTPAKEASDISDEEANKMVKETERIDFDIEVDTEKHLLTFKKEEAEESALEDHKPADDTLGEQRHTEGYETKFEKEHVSKVLSPEKAEFLSHSLISQIKEIKRERSNSYNLLTPDF